MPLGVIAAGFIFGCVGGFVANVALKLCDGIQLSFEGIPPEGGGSADEQTEKQSA